MRRLLHDRYLVTGLDRVRDLATGNETRLERLESPETSDSPPVLRPLLDALDHGREGEPAWLMVALPDATERARLVQAIANNAQRKGYVPLAVSLYQQTAARLGDELRDRALVLLDVDDDGPRAWASLLAAAATSARPHMLITFRSPRKPSNLAREAHSRFGGAAVRHAPAVHSEVVRLLARASRATEFVLAGRHAAAERLLREVSAGLARRHACGEAAQIGVELGWLLLERGRSLDADLCGAEAARLADAGESAAAACQARLLQAWARLDQLRLSDAESIARAVILCAPDNDTAACARATLAKCLLDQRRRREVAAIDLGWSEFERSDLRWQAILVDVAVAVLVDAGRLFEAGQRARAALDRWPTDSSPLQLALLHTAHLRVLLATGDLTLAADILERALAAARRARAPLRALRARAVWCEGLTRGGANDAGAAAYREVRRLARVAPPALRREVEAAARPSSAAFAPAATGDANLAAQMIALAQDDDDGAAVGAVIQLVMRHLDAVRIEVVSGDAGPVTVLVAAGSGPGSSVSARVLESGIAIGFETGSGDVGVPVRVGPRLLAALSARWPSGREHPPDRQSVLECAAAVIAVRIDALHQRSREAASASVDIPELIGVSGATVALRKAVVRAARAPFSVLIEGESGVGKELVARAIHQLSPRRDRRFCDVNCAALPDELFEAEIFGHARGAFTGAVADRPGLFEEASGGTLFLDEVADLTMRAQAKLLRAVQQQEIRRVGESSLRRVDVRFVAAANRLMTGEVEAGRFRPDLLYRLDVIHIRIAPLRERPEDTPVIARHLWAQATERVGSSARLSAGVMAALARYPWPGNVRELQNVLAALVVAAPLRGQVRASLLPAVISTSAGVNAGHLAAARDQFERRFIELALARAGGNRSRAARAIGLSRQGLLKSMARLGLKAQTLSPAP